MSILAKEVPGSGSAEQRLRAVAPGEEWAESGTRPEGLSDFRGNVMADKRASAAAKRTAGLPREWGGLSRARERVPPLLRCAFGNSSARSQPRPPG